MRDFSRLRAHLTAALLVGACGPHRNPNKPNFSCPSHEWCAPSAEVKQLAPNDPDMCPAIVNVDPRRKDLPADWPTDVSMMTREQKQPNDGTCCYLWSPPCGGGRPFVDDHGNAVLAQVQDASASRWLTDALAEHASVASLPRATRAQRAVGGPDELVHE
jgi:hypothetical protein